MTRSHSGIPSPASTLFRGLTEHTFQSELGIADPRLVGYVANLLACFVPSQSIWRLHDRQGRRLLEVSAMLAEAATAADAGRRRECHRHVGDYTLFWTGVYPEALPKLRASGSPDHLIDFQRQGKRSYYLASTLEDGDEAPLLRRLSEQFELCAFGLSRVRREQGRTERDRIPRHGTIPPPGRGLAVRKPCPRSAIFPSRLRAVSKRPDLPRSGVTLLRRTVALLSEGVCSRRRYALKYEMPYPGREDSSGVRAISNA